MSKQTGNMYGKFADLDELWEIEDGKKEEEKKKNEKKVK